MEKKLFKTALEFIEKYEIASYAINIWTHPHALSRSRIKIQGHAFENNKAMMELDIKCDGENNWYKFTENGIDLTLTYE